MGYEDGGIRHLFICAHSMVTPQIVYGLVKNRAGQVGVSREKLDSVSDNRRNRSRDQLLEV